MINLLPPETKSGIHYARINSLLLKWLGAMVLFVIGISAILFFGTIYLGNTTKKLEADVATINQTIDAQKLNEVQAKTNEISNNLKLMLQVFQKRILFSSLIKQIGAALPNGSQIKTLSITNSDSTLQLDVEATDFATATQVAINLKDPQAKLFSSVDVESVDCTDSPETYKCTSRVRGLLLTDGQYKFINNLQGSGQ